MTKRGVCELCVHAAMVLCEPAPVPTCAMRICVVSVCRKLSGAGGELLEAVAKKGSYSEADARGCFAQLLAGVSYLHAHGIAHRDLKLENLLLETPGDITHIRIVDFGLAKGHVEQSYLEMDTICGTPHYVAPEVIAVRGSWPGQFICSSAAAGWRAHCSDPVSYWQTCALKLRCGCLIQIDLMHQCMSGGSGCAGRGAG